MKKAYHGSCHCGAVRFSANIDLAPEGQRSKPEREGVWWTATFRCNCSSCLKSRFWKAFVRPADFTLIAGEEALAEYRFGERGIAHRFCRNCGVRPFASADFEPLGGAFHCVNVACLDDATPEELEAAPVIFEDGHNNDWDKPPALSGYL
ncbi:GFA family protein [Nitratireductor pacificus]|uniref:Glutathione-dependent formaldehyde-activating protein n=1 Tax=Nitratireductor pacificus pht-3B TaxID=391937 RepID=K2M5J2_9HYPH|nr:GFA family protein [Nitratireductor pacificus]EKF17416.1 glutathione-dependent formaldehyde-activating protein [Nitratireductor pacificus pht-3B]